MYWDQGVSLYGALDVSDCVCDDYRGAVDLFPWETDVGGGEEAVAWEGSGTRC